MKGPAIETVPISRYENGLLTHPDDLLAVEEPLEIQLQYGANKERRAISVTMRTPGNDKELAAGFLFTEGIIESMENVKDVVENSSNTVTIILQEHVKTDLEKLKRNFYTSSSCGVCGKESIEAIKTVCSIKTSGPAIKISSQIILSLHQSLHGNQNVFAQTGGLHAASLFDSSGNLLLLKEDVGRHNALDKLIGAALMNDKLKKQLHQNMLLLSGRASFELVQKAAMAGIPVVCAVGAPSSLAVSLAKEFDITLIGFLKETRFNIYTGAANVITT